MTTSSFTFPCPTASASSPARQLTLRVEPPVEVFVHRQTRADIYCQNGSSIHNRTAGVGSRSMMFKSAAVRPGGPVIAFSFICASIKFLAETAEKIHWLFVFSAASASLREIILSGH
jgi:hypothetical protein